MASLKAHPCTQPCNTGGAGASAGGTIHWGAAAAAAAAAIAWRAAAALDVTAASAASAAAAIGTAWVAVDSEVVYL